MVAVGSKLLYIPSMGSKFLSSLDSYSWTDYYF